MKINVPFSKVHLILLTQVLVIPFQERLAQTLSLYLEAMIQVSFDVCAKMRFNALDTYTYNEDKEHTQVFQENNMLNRKVLIFRAHD